ncbi:MAG: TonB-dependent receptor plug domain-containing protein, partial [Lentisphaeria bacterium]|nr:TonB-dependent receptor plug domain-containing protein [Lentisphaeria bacterium]
MSIRRGTGLLAMAALAGIALRAEPAEGETQQMDDVVITATRSETSTREIPANVTVITAQDIADGNYSDVVGVLQSLGGLHFRSFSGNQEATVDIRGFGENSHGRVLILRDGRRLNRPDMRGINWSQIPLASIERIEILRGPGGAMYGDNAVGGVINIITKKGTAEPTGEVVVEGGSQSYNRQALSLLGNLAGLDYALSLERSESSGWRHRTGTRTEGGDLSLGYDLAEGLRLDVNIGLLHTEYEMPGGLLSKAAFKANPRAAQNLFDEAAEDYFTINPTLTAQLAETVEIIFETGYSRKEIESDMPSYFTPTWSDMLVETWTVSPRFVFTA